MPRKVSADQVAWVPAGVAAELLGDEIPEPGEYRLVEKGKLTGPRVVWVDGNPEDPEDLAGHFELAS